MKQKKYSCGKIFPSGCVIYTGELPTFLPTESVSCDANIDEIFEKYGEKIDQILENSDLTGLTQGSLIFNPATVTIKQLHQLQINALQNHQISIDALEEQLADLNIGESLIEIDLDCLETEAAPCESAPNTYSLLSLLLLFKSEICALKEEVFG